MKKCLVTKLNGVVDNDSLLKIGEMRVGFVKVANPETNVQAISVGVSEPTILKIVGDGYFTDKTLSENKGKQITVGEDTSMAVYAVFVSNNDTQVSIQNKYNILQLNKYYSSNAKGSDLIVINLDDFKYSSLLTSLIIPNTQVSGDIANLKNLTALTALNLNATQVSGDIANLKNLTALTTLNLSNIQVSGDIANLKNLTALTALNLNATQVSGDISALKNLTALTTLNLSSTTSVLTGDIGVLNKITKLTIVGVSNSNLTGDLALIPPLCKFASFQNSKGSRFSWSQRSESSKILAIEGSPFISDIDRMLVNQAQCQSGITSSDAIWYKTISCSGVRTSASDAAVQTLQSKGYTVSITPA